MDPSTGQARRDVVQQLDVRELDEWATGHIEGSIHIPLEGLGGRIFELDLARPVVAVCRSGRRSSRAAAFLGSLGLAADSLEGGLKARVDSGLPLVTSDGHPGHLTRDLRILQEPRP